ncbi:TadE/TadG family type IV pilus assembly protein [Kordiimonas sediminis]|nr:TadE/TadG family type IV pilus assembly protein [Kordiimonas sediminis]
MLRTKLCTGLFSLKRNEDGAIMIKTALLLVPFIALLGIGIDMSRIYLYRSELSGALDSAALAGGKAFNQFNEAEREAQIRAFFNENFPTNYMGGTLGELDIVPDEANTTLTITTTGILDMTFMRVLGFDKVPITVSAQATSKTTGLQLAMILDATGSMVDDGKIDDLQDASHTMIDALFGNNLSDDKLQISIIPYVTAANVGGAIDHDFIDFSDMPSSYTYDRDDISKWNGCVEARVTNSALDSGAMDVRPDFSGHKWKPYFWTPGHSNNDYFGIDGLVVVNPAGKVLPWSQAGHPKHKKFKGNGGNRKYDRGPNLACPLPMLDFSETSSEIHDYIDEIQPAYRLGGTVPITGMVWGWRRLQHNQEYFNNINDVPNDDSLTVKAAILMTDGENKIVSNISGPIPHYDGKRRMGQDRTDTIDDDGDGNCPGCNNVWDRDDEELGIIWKGDYSAYGRRDLGRLDGATTSTSAINAINKRLAFICSGMKSDNIVIYTVTFGSGATDTSLQNLYQGCASDPAKYFHAPSALELENAFEAIANDLSNLRLSK